MDKGTNALKMLKNELISLKHGYIAVRNRSQDDIIQKVKVQNALETEAEFFEKHASYRELKNCGTAFLSQTLTKLLFNHMKDNLPQLEKEIDNYFFNNQSRNIAILSTALMIICEEN